MARSKQTSSSFIVVLFISCIVLYIIVFSYDDYNDNISRDDDSSILLRQRSLGVSDFNDPKSTEARIEESSSTTTSIQFYIKSSGKPTYLSRSRRIATTWAKETNNQITFLFDTDNNAGVVRFQEQYPWITIRQINGTLRQGEYKGGGDANAAFIAQRIKTRAVFTDYDATYYYNNTTNNKLVPDWICYLDDDMSVHVTNLMEDLEQRKSSCTPNCWIGDTYHNNFAAGGWCMQKELANKVKDLLKLKTDEEIGWDGTDDGGFSKSVMRGRNGIQPSVSIIDSNRWFSEFHRPMCGEHENCTVTGYKKINQRISWKNPWTKNRAFMDEWYPHVAVYFNVYGMRSFHSRKPYVVGSGPKRTYRHSYYKSAK